MKSTFCLGALLLMVFLFSCQTGMSGTIKSDSSPRKKALLVIAPKAFADLELFTPKNILEQEGVQVVVAGLRVEQVTGMGGGTITPDIAVSDVKVADYDLVAIIGGMGTIEFLWDNDEVRALVREAAAKGKKVAAICAGPVVLARAGLLEGKQSTGFPDPSITNEITKVGANYTSAVVTKDGNIITGKNPEAAEAFGKALAESLR